MAKPGDKVKVITKKEKVEGILMPSTDPKAVIIKLESGYNLGLKKKEVKSLVVIKKSKETRAVVKKISKDKNLPTLAILHTGGTIASKVDYNSGGVIARFSAEDLVEMFPELSKIANVETELVANMMSEDMRFSDYQKIAQAVKKQAEKGVEGVIIGHGTDTLGYTAAALAFMFEKINIPVILVGSQRSSDRGSTDAAQNLICAAEFIVKTDFAGVAICMHHSASDDSCAILPATKTRKMHTSRRDAFKAVNDSLIALVDYNKREVKFLKKDYPKKSKTKVILKDKFAERVGILRTHPNMHKEIFEFFRKNNYQGLVLEATGIGQAPTNTPENLPNYEELKKFIDSGGIVVLTSQCIFGRVHEDIYTNCRRLKEIGVIFGEDMLTETAFIKLAWLLGNYPKEKVKGLMVKNLKGEISERTSYDEDFLK